MGRELDRRDSTPGGVPSWMAAMRAAVFDAVTATDMVEITQSIVTKAKGGDLRAADFLFRYIVGSPAAKGQIDVTVQHGQPETVIDLGRRPDQPGPAAIRAAALKIRAQHGHANGNGSGRED